MKIFIAGRAVLLADQVEEAATFWQRALGLWRFPRLRPGGGLYLKSCNWVHTLGMSYAIDAVHLDAQQRVVACETLKPGRIGRWVRAGCDVLELTAGTCQSAGCQKGDRLEIV
jgi:uncharacterized membrane protein (UPF0127 family)